MNLFFALTMWMLIIMPIQFLFFALYLYLMWLYGITEIIYSKLLIPEFAEWFMVCTSKMGRQHMFPVMWGHHVLNKKSFLEVQNLWRYILQEYILDRKRLKNISWLVLISEPLLLIIMLFRGNMLHELMEYKALQSCTGYVFNFLGAAYKWSVFMKSKQ